MPSQRLAFDRCNCLMSINGSGPSSVSCRDIHNSPVKYPNSRVLQNPWALIPSSSLRNPIIWCLATASSVISICLSLHSDDAKSAPLVPAGIFQRRSRSKITIRNLGF
jgi:hypothetical protein